MGVARRGRCDNCYSSDEFPRSVVNGSPASSDENMLAELNVYLEKLFDKLAIDDSIFGRALADTSRTRNRN